MLIVAPDSWASPTVSTNEAILSGAASCCSLKKMRTSCGSSAFTFASRPGRLPGGAGVIAAYTCWLNCTP